MNYHHFYDIQFAFDKGSIKALGNQGGDTNQDGNGNQVGSDNQGGNDNQGGTNNLNENPTVDPKNLKDGQYDIAFKVLKDKTEEISMMNQYVVSPARLTVKDGKKYVAMTLKNSDWITKFQTENNGGFADAKVVSEDKAANTRVVEFEANDLFAKLNAKVKVDIDSMNYHHFYDVQIQFDTTKIGAVGTVKEEPKNEPKNPVTTPKVDNVKTVGTPDFNRNADGKKKNEATNNDSKKEKNSKTADTAQLGLYMVLLLGSLALLVRKYRAGRL